MLNCNVLANDVEPSPRDRVNSLEVKMPSKRPEPNIPEDILEQPIMDNQRARSFTDSEGFYEEVSFYPLFSQLDTVKIANFEDNSINVLKEH